MNSEDNLAAKKMSWKILLVDDDEDDYIITRYILNNCPDIEFQVDWISNYSQALVEIENCSYDAILVDYDLGSGKTGVDLIDALKESGCTIPMIIYTGRVISDNFPKNIPRGPSEFMQKSTFNGQLLETAILLALEKKSDS